VPPGDAAHADAEGLGHPAAAIHAPAGAATVDALALPSAPIED
jgi:hypothetical protein